MKSGAVVALALGLAMAGCSADYVENNQAAVLLVMESVNGGSPVLSDVRGEGGAIVNCLATVAVQARNKNLSPDAVTSPANDVRLSRYEVSYVRSDGRGVEGVDVPYRIVGNLTLLVPSGGDTVSTSIDLVRHQAKLEPPLSNMVGAQVVTMIANITLHGSTISGNTVTASGAAQVTFADFADGTQTCESGS